ncbi:hypothetical protein E4U50_002753 [Claviceps purpurea]|nr:hypothetical protein E4U50_002753 [Claviceps purpurea]
MVCKNLADQEVGPPIRLFLLFLWAGNGSPNRSNFYPTPPGRSGGTGAGGLAILIEQTVKVQKPTSGFNGKRSSIEQTAHCSASRSTVE